MSKHPKTPDGKYFLVKDRLWRCTDPSIPENRRKKLVKELMTARRQVKSAKSNQNKETLRAARKEVHRCKVALGERGPVWWDDGEEDVNRKHPKNTRYKSWYLSLGDS